MQNAQSRLTILGPRGNQHRHVSRARNAFNQRDGNFVLPSRSRRNSSSLGPYQIARRANGRRNFLGPEMAPLLRIGRGVAWKRFSARFSLAADQVRTVR